MTAPVPGGQDGLTPTQLIFGREPAFWAGAVQAAVSLLTSLGLSLTPEQQGSIVAGASALIGLWLAYQVRPLSVAAFTTVIQAGLALAVAFGLTLSVEQQGAALAIAAVVLNMVLVRPQVIPMKGWITAETGYIGRHRAKEE